jgi:hypothetical protein
MADSNSDEAASTAGRPDASSWVMSCELHDAQDPQSARASITASHRVRISTRRSAGAGLV